MPMASDTTNTMKPSNLLSAAVQLQPELLMAAKRGDLRKLGELMSEEGASVPKVVVDIKDTEPPATWTHTYGPDSILVSEEGTSVPKVVVDIEDAEPPATWMHTYGPDSILHVVASGGDGEAFLMSATLIYGKAKHLLGMCNAKGDTPLHCAARSGSIKMVSHLIDLASRDDDGGAERVQVALRKQNNRGETALHEAIRWPNEKMVGVLLSADPELARFPRTKGTSPLYLAILLGHDHIAEQLFDRDSQLSCSGPDGQNVLHVAVLRSERMTKKLLAWNKNLIKEGDRSSRRTPLHFAASRGTHTPMDLLTDFRRRRRAKLLLEADESSAYQSDNKGSFPIHVAALGNNYDVVHVLLEKCPDCIQLQDARGRTFLHLAVSKKHCFLVWHTFYQAERFASIMNMQDDEGNTALHLAAMAGSPETMYPLIWNKEVQINLPNKEEQTALDLSLSKTPSGVFFGLDPNIRIRRLLKFSGGRSGVRPGGEKQHAPELDVKGEAKKIKDSTTTIGVVSVLIVTVSFAAVFQLPGGYKADDKPLGTPQLADKYSFQAFVVANNLAVFCSAMATISLMYAGVSTVDIQTRVFAFIASIFFLNSSARSLVAAFAFGTYAVLAPVAHASSLLTWLLMGLLLLDVVWFTCLTVVDHLVLLKGRGIMRTCLSFVDRNSIVTVPLSVLWPYVVIAGFIAYSKVHGIH